MPTVAFTDGEFSPVGEMTVGIAAHALHYGTSVFEGLRAYWNADAEEFYILCGMEHYARLHASARMYGKTLPYSVEDLCRISADLLVHNEAREDVHIRPLLYVGTQGSGLWRSGLEESFVIFHVPMSNLYDDEGGQDLPAGITRASVIELVTSELGMQVVERPVNRGESCCADEVFLWGTAAEVTPVIAVDNRPAAEGRVGAVTKAVRDLYADVVRGRNEARMSWCHPVYRREEREPIGAFAAPMAEPVS
jgi:branched-chain amino acid aminotransferase